MIGWQRFEREMLREYILVVAITWRGKTARTSFNALKTFFCADETSFRLSLTLSKATLVGFWSLVIVKLAV